MTAEEHKKHIHEQWWMWTVAGNRIVDSHGFEVDKGELILEAVVEGANKKQPSKEEQAATDKAKSAEEPAKSH
jgi:hypothetical protein